MSGSRAFSNLFLPVRAPKPREQKGNTFLHNHAEHNWACNTSTNHRPAFQLAFRLLLYPADAWITEQVREVNACREGPKYLINDNGGKFG
jgi:hypothetical protein